MANDNQTALMQSIHRKKDTLEFLIKRRKFISENGCMADVPELDDLASKIEVYEYEITEDEKLLLVDENQISDAFESGQCAVDIAYYSPEDDNFVSEHGIVSIGNGKDYYPKKYGIDGK